MVFSLLCVANCLGTIVIHSPRFAALSPLFSLCLCVLCAILTHIHHTHLSHPKPNRLSSFLHHFIIGDLKTVTYVSELAPPSFSALRGRGCQYAYTQVSSKIGL